MKRTPLKRKTALKAKRSGLNRLSPARVRQLQAEFPDRMHLCMRAHGTPVTEEKTSTISGKAYSYTKVTCKDGVCECGCGHTGNLEPHEKISRGRGGKLSVSNSIMVLRDCHCRLQKSEPIWTSNISIDPIDFSPCGYYND